MSLPKSCKIVGQKMFRTRTFNVEQNQARTSTNGPRCVEQIRQMTWLEVRRLWSSGLSGYWALAVFLVVGHAACHITGPSVILSVILAAITSALSGLCLSELITRPGLNGGHPVSGLFTLLGEFPAFILAWIDIIGQIAAISACGRAMAATVDKTTDSRLHDLVMANFGLTPFLNTYPDFLAGGAVMITALFIAAGMEESKTLRSWLNGFTFGALTFVIVVGIWEANPDTLRDQPFLLDGSKGVILSAAVVYVVFGGSVRVGNGARTSSQPCRLIPLANGLSQLSMTLTLFAVAIILPMIAKLSPLGLVPEVPLLQAFENDEGRGWTRFVVAGLAVICLNITLLELSLPLHSLIQDLVREGLLFRPLGIPYSRTDTPFFGCVIIGSLTAVVATLGDVTRLLMIAATSRVALDLLVCLACLAVRYGVGCRHKDGGGSGNRKSSNRNKQMKRKSRLNGTGADGLQTISRSVSCHAPVASALPTTHTTNLHHDEGAQRNGGRSGGAAGVDAAERRKLNVWTKFSNFLRSNVHVWKFRNNNYENVGDANNQSSFYWGEAEGVAPLGQVRPSLARGGAPSSLVATDESVNLQSEDNNTETESSPSGYETDSSSDDDFNEDNGSDEDDGDDDTDIDVIIDEYRSCSSLATISLSSVDQREINPGGVSTGSTVRRRPNARPRPTQRTSNCVLMSTCLLLVAFGTQYFIIESMQTTTVAATIIMNLGLSVTVFALILLIAKQPQDRPPGIENTFLVPLTPWTHFLAIFLNLSLVAHVVPETLPEMSVWILFGFIFYFSYGIRHSKAGDAQNRNFLHHPRRPTHLNLTPIIPETETTSNRNSGSSSIIRFSDNTNNRKSSFSDAR